MIAASEQGWNIFTLAMAATLFPFAAAVAYIAWDELRGMFSDKRPAPPPVGPTDEPNAKRATLERHKANRW